MKKFTFFAIAALAGLSAAAQQRVAVPGKRVPVEKAGLMKGATAAAKTTATDTIQGAVNFPGQYLDSLIAYSVDPSQGDYGYIFGTNSYKDSCFAERFDFRTGDTTAKVLAVITYFSGTYSPSTTKTINLRVWNQAGRTAFPNQTKWFYSGLPGTVLATQNVSIKNLGINIGSGTDSFKYTAFTTPMAALSDTFFVGYDMNYNPNALAGDTIGLFSTVDGARFSPYDYLSGTDTIVNVRNATHYGGSGSAWHDNAYENFGIGNHLAIFPVVVRQYGLGGGGGTAVTPVRKNSLAWYGHYPNPATDVLNISMSLDKASDVTITVMSLEGRILSNTTESKLTPGDHVLPLSISNLPAGTYTYLLRTNGMDGVASQFTVVR